MPEDGRLPHDPEAERAVLAAVLLDRRHLDGVREIVRAEDFLDVRHRRIFEICCALDDAPETRKIDLVTVRAELDRAGQLAAAGGRAYLSELYDGVARSTNAVEYARLVRERSLSRELHRFGSKVASEALRSAPGEILESAEKNLFRIAEGSYASGPVAIAGELSRIADEADEQREGFAGIRTGLHDLDELMGGLRKSDLILVGARPGEGKTSLALNIALAAGRERRRVLIFSLEMPLRQIVTRLLFSQAMVDARQLHRPGMLSEQDRKRVRSTLSLLDRMPIYVDDSNVTPVELRSKSRQLFREHGLDLIVVDYLQLMRAGEPGQRFENRNLELAEISRSLKALAKELDVPVLALSQLSRAPEQRSGDFGMPRLSDLRESGALEQDADIVLLIHRERPKRGAEAAPDSRVEHGPPVRRIIVAKNRNGPTGMVKLAWLDKYTRFETFADEAATRDADIPAYPDPSEDLEF